MELQFGDFTYQVPSDRADFEDWRHTVGCVPFDEAFDHVTRKIYDPMAFAHAARTLYGQMSTVYKYLREFLSEGETNLVITHLIEMRKWLELRSGIKSVEDIHMDNLRNLNK